MVSVREKFLSSVRDRTKNEISRRETPKVHFWECMDHQLHTKRQCVCTCLQYSVRSFWWLMNTSHWIHINDSCHTNFSFVSSIDLHGHFDNCNRNIVIITRMASVITRIHNAGFYYWPEYLLVSGVRELPKRLICMLCVIYAVTLFYTSYIHAHHTRVSKPLYACIK